jgi:UDP-glucose 4-epimerase
MINRLLVATRQYSFVNNHSSLFHMNILITGGAGYIGTELVRHLVSLPQIDNIIIYDNLSKGNYNLFLGNRLETNKIKFIFGDLLDSRKLRKSLQGIDMVFHLAAKVTTPFDNTDSHFYEQVNHWGTAELVYAIEESNVSKLIYVSSTSVYGSSSDMLTDNSSPNPETFYGISKLRAETHIKRLFNKINTLIIRCGNVYGYSPSMRFDAVINRFMFDANFNNRISINGNGKQHRSFIHIDKLVAGLAQVIPAHIPSGIYNLTDKNIQLLDLIDVFKEIFPSLEFLFINQHLTLKEIKIDPNSKLREYITLPESTLKQELIGFKEKFAFSSSDVILQDKGYGQGI